MRYKFLVFREQGAGSREEGKGKREEGKNNVYLMSPRNAIYELNPLNSKGFNKIKMHFY